MRPNLLFHPLLNPLRDFRENPLFSQFKGGWKLFSKKGPEAVRTQHKPLSFDPPASRNSLPQIPPLLGPSKLLVLVEEAQPAGPGASRILREIFLHHCHVRLFSPCSYATTHVDTQRRKQFLRDAETTLLIKLLRFGGGWGGSIYRKLSKNAAFSWEIP